MSSSIHPKKYSKFVYMYQGQNSWRNVIIWPDSQPALKQGILIFFSEYVSLSDGLHWFCAERCKKTQKEILNTGFNIAI